MHKFILKRVRFKFPAQNSNLARQCKSGSHDGTPHSGPKSQKPGHEGCSLIIRAMNSWFLMKSCMLRFSRLLIMNLQFILQKSKMADPKWRQFFF
jgi:hypothetical protein